MTNFSNFAAQNKGQLALAFFRTMFENPDITLGELKDALCDTDVQPFLSTTLGAVLPSSNTPKTKKKRKELPEVTNEIMAILQANATEGFTVAELMVEVDAAEPTIRKALTDLVTSPDVMVYNRPRATEAKGKDPLEYIWLG